MNRVQCNACAGVYLDELPDGGPYFHVCPTETLVEAELDDGKVEERPLPQWAGVVLVKDQAEKDQLVAKGTPARDVAIEQRRRDRRRAGHRDENTLRRLEDKDRTRVAKSDGAGVTVLERDVPRALTTA